MKIRFLIVNIGVLVLTCICYSGCNKFKPNAKLEPIPWQGPRNNSFEVWNFYSWVLNVPFLGSGAGTQEVDIDSAHSTPQTSFMPTDGKYYIHALVRLNNVTKDIPDELIFQQDMDLIINRYHK